MEPVRNHRSQVVVDASRLHRARERRDTGLTLLEGPHLLDEAVKAKADIRTVFIAAGDTAGNDAATSIGIEPVVVDERALQRIAGTETPRGPVAVVAIPPQHPPLAQHLLVAWGVSDPGNVGTMIRVAAAFGWDFSYTAGTADPWSPKVLRAGAGSQFSVGITEVLGLDEIRSGGYAPVASVVSGGADPGLLENRRWAVLIGEEASGLPDDVVAASDGSISIPMPGGFESLNAAVAAGVLTYLISKHSGEAGEQV
ncbi:MAG: RNA methyltransferase [Acidimicrobiia bacterium]